LFAAVADEKIGDSNADNSKRFLHFARHETLATAAGLERRSLKQADTITSRHSVRFVHRCQIAVLSGNDPGGPLLGFFSGRGGHIDRNELRTIPKISN
jgi:hypothetical protein